eukprot:scaffold7513_cov76-Skeletonema_dohrnii-CCMP3373.AAC.4
MKTWTTADLSFECPQQDNDSDCGVFHLLKLCLLVEGEAITEDPYSQASINAKDMRKTIAYILWRTSCNRSSGTQARSHEKSNVSIQFCSADREIAPRHNYLIDFTSQPKNGIPKRSVHELVESEKRQCVSGKGSECLMTENLDPNTPGTPNPRQKDFPPRMSNHMNHSTKRESFIPKAKANKSMNAILSNYFE